MCGVDLAALQHVTERTFGLRDRARGPVTTATWLQQEVRLLLREIRNDDHAAIELKLGDVLSSLATVANQMDIDLSTAVARYAKGCPNCAGIPCDCKARWLPSEVS